jgi:hypothetical protein
MDEPKKIYNWQDSQLSIARHYGGITMDGIRYDIHYEEEGQPLVEFIPKKKERKKKVLKTAPIEANFALFEEPKYDNT